MSDAPPYTQDGEVAKRIAATIPYYPVRRAILRNSSAQFFRAIL